MVTMFGELSAMFNLKDDLPKNEFILVTERNVDASFVLHHFISAYLKKGHHVCVVAFYQSFFHYYNIGLKLGLNLKTIVNQGLLTFVDGLQLAAEHVHRRENDSNGISSEDPYSEIVNGETPALQKMFRHVENKFRELTGRLEEDSRCLFVVDDVGTFLGLGVSVEELVRFVRACRTMCDMHPPSTCFLPLMHRVAKDCEDEDNDAVASHLGHLCDIIVDVRGLETGFCKDIHGQIQVIHKAPVLSTTRKQNQFMQFKVEERNVRIFLPGNSPAIL